MMGVFQRKNRRSLESAPGLVLGGEGSRAGGVPGGGVCFQACGLNRSICSVLASLCVWLSPMGLQAFGQAPNLRNFLTATVITAKTYLGGFLAHGNGNGSGLAA